MNLRFVEAFIGLPRGVAAFIGGRHLSPFWLPVLPKAFFIVLGCVLDGISMVMLTMAVPLINLFPQVVPWLPGLM